MNVINGCYAIHCSLHREDTKIAKALLLFAKKKLSWCPSRLRGLNVLLIAQRKRLKQNTDCVDFTFIFAIRV